MPTEFTTLSIDWNADPNAPYPEVNVVGTELKLRFELNGYVYPQFKEGDWAEITFSSCIRYRLGPTNDEGWYLGQCRFSKIAPEWGEFYEVTGDLMLDAPGIKWHILSDHAEPNKHFLFYFRDETFECDASAWSIAFHTSSDRPSLGA